MDSAADEPCSPETVPRPDAAAVRIGLRFGLRFGYWARAGTSMASARGYRSPRLAGRFASSAGGPLIPLAGQLGRYVSTAYSGAAANIDHRLANSLVKLAEL